MTPSITTRARATWISLPDRDFNAIDDLMAHLIEAEHSDQTVNLDILAEIDVGYYTATVYRTDMLTALVENTRNQIYALGRPF
ncbi:MAG: hypothetical protein GY926_24550 [bacterium]|nr:hypothetical protein [bacterium]